MGVNYSQDELKDTSMSNLSTVQHGIDPIESSKIVNLNPWIHGTSSKILEILPYTEFQILDPIMMIEKYKIGPITGEISGGGFGNVWNHCHPRFGRVFSENYNSYDLSKVKRYTKLSKDDPRALLKNALLHGSQYGYSNLNIILIYAQHCRQCGYDIDDLITLTDIKDMKLTRNSFAILLFINTYLIPHDLDLDTRYVMVKYLTLKHFKDILKTTPLDLYMVYKNKIITAEIWDLLECSFTLPKTSWVELYDCNVDKQIIIDDIFPFTKIQKPDYETKSKFTSSYFIYRMLQNVSSYGMNDIWRKEYKNDSEIWNNLHTKLSYYIDAFDHRMSLLENLLSSETVSQITIPTDSYPLILICEDNSVLEPIQDEYVAKGPLKLGTHITKLATDTPKHKLMLEAYLNYHQLPCHVILFDDLQK